MISYKCSKLICQEESGLIYQAEQCIRQIEAEISYINTLILESSSLQLAPIDLVYYQSELKEILFGNTTLLHCTASFLNSLYKHLSIDDTTSLT
jgi:hypothetical protein